jgi:molybdate transport system substrate-binding protein
MALYSGLSAAADELRIAAASDLRFAMKELVQLFQLSHTEVKIEVVYGSSGKLATQIQNGAPFDIFFSADISYPRLLSENTFTASPVYTYAFGHIVVWSMNQNVELQDLVRPDVKKIAIANPQHAPYGHRAQEALEAIGIWTNIQDKLVMGENISQTAQFVESGAADAGIVARSIVMSPAMSGKGAWTLIDENLHAPLEQGFAVLKRAAENQLAFRFASFISSPEAKDVLEKYGFEIPRGNNSTL